MKPTTTTAYTIVGRDEQGAPLGEALLLRAYTYDQARYWGRKLLRWNAGIAAAKVSALKRKDGAGAGGGT